MLIHFEKASEAHVETIFSWLREPPMLEFWDNTQAHKDDIKSFIEGRKSPSAYANGKYVYWIASFNHEPFAMLMTIQETHKDNISQEKLSRFSKTGHTYGLDYMIGNPNFFGKGYGAITLSQFIDYFRVYVDSKADTFLIDPANDNPRAKHVYEKAGFTHICDFVMEGDCSGAGQLHHLLIQKFKPTISVIEANLDDYPLVQNMARFYVYDISRYCGHGNPDWAVPKDGLYESFDFKDYFTDPSRKAYLIKVYDETAGFVLLKKGFVILAPDAACQIDTWHMGEFFIMARFQRKGIAHSAVHKIWDMHQGRWEIAVIPDNELALSFWKKAVSSYTKGVFSKGNYDVTFDPYQPKRVVFMFDTKGKDLKTPTYTAIRASTKNDMEWLVELSRQKRLSYEKAQPQFWRYSGPLAEVEQKKWFEGMLMNPDAIMLTAESLGEIVGFIIGQLIKAPAVYNPGGLTLMIDDFCVKESRLWQSVGHDLVEAAMKTAKNKGACQSIVVTGRHDKAKTHFLSEAGFSNVSQWFVRSL